MYYFELSHLILKTTFLLVLFSKFDSRLPEWYNYCFLLTSRNNHKRLSILGLCLGVQKTLYLSRMFGL